MVAHPQGGLPFGPVVWTCLYPNTRNHTHRHYHSHLSRGEVQHCHLPRFMVVTLLGVPLGFLLEPLLGFLLSFLVGELLKFLRGLLQDQGIFQEGLLGLHPCCYFHRHYHHPDHCCPMPLLRCHPHGERQQNHSRCQIVQQTAVNFCCIYTIRHAWQVPQRVG